MGSRKDAIASLKTEIEKVKAESSDRLTVHQTVVWEMGMLDQVMASWRKNMLSYTVLERLKLADLQLIAEGLGLIAVQLLELEDNVAAIVDPPKPERDPVVPQDEWEKSIV